MRARYKTIFCCFILYNYYTPWQNILHGVIYFKRVLNTRLKYLTFFFFLVSPAVKFYLNVTHLFIITNFNVNLYKQFKSV